MLIQIAIVCFILNYCNAGLLKGHNHTTHNLEGCDRSNMAHNIESYTTDGRPCMNNCEGGYCFTSSLNTYVCEPCVKGEKNAPTYYTSLRQSLAPKCLTRCGTYGYEYNWCLINNKSGWDYCNPDTDYRQTVTAFSANSGPCKGACGYSGSNYTWCYTYWFDWDHCDPETFVYDQVRTVYGNECRGLCESSEERRYKWCYNQNTTAEPCAPVAVYVKEAASQSENDKEN